MILMEKAKAKIDSWEPSEEPEFIYPKNNKEIKISPKDLTPKLIKAFKDGLNEGLRK